ncbi:MAG: outer membrane beta-barrel protein [Colwellia sp.]|nr:outer membrane beta-barrel protein [Colwellia sp.]
MIKALLLLILLSLNVSSSEYQIDLGYSKVEHSWRGPDNYAKYETGMESLGLTYITDIGIAFRAGYGVLSDSKTKGKYEDLVLEMNYIFSLELTYRYSFDLVTVYAGIGKYTIPTSVSATSSDYYDHDYDNDEGYLIGIEYMIDEDVSIGYRYNMMSRITSDPYDEWTKSHGIYLSYRF